MQKIWNFLFNIKFQVNLMKSSEENKYTLGYVKQIEK